MTVPFFEQPGSRWFNIPAHRPFAAGTSTDISTLLTSQWARTAVQLTRAQ